MPVIRVRPVSPLWNLDRELDYLISDRDEALFGQRVLVPLGSQKTPELAIVTDQLAHSEFAKRPIDRVLREPSVISREHMVFLEQVARRYCVSLGEILALAIPDFMPRAAASIGFPKTANRAHERHIDNRLGGGITRKVSLTAPRSEIVGGTLIPNWVQVAIRDSKDALSGNRTVMICVPEQSDIELLCLAFARLAPEIKLVAQPRDETRSQRYVRFRTLQEDGLKVSIVTRSGILWEQNNLGLILVHDDLDDSFREPGSPFYSVWEVALLRASELVAVHFISAYRSGHLQRLVHLGYLNSHGSDTPIRNIEFSEPSELSQKTIIPFLKKAVSTGTALILTTRKGSHVAIRCRQCGGARNCLICEAPYWMNSLGRIECRVCRQAAAGSCEQCGSNELSPGKLGSTRIAADLGKALPGARVIEVDANSTVNFGGKPNQIVVATPGTAPYLSEGYSGLVVFDAMAWQNSLHPTSELIAHRDWLGTIELLQPSAPVYLRNVDSAVAQRFVLGQFISVAATAVNEAVEHDLYPQTKYLRIELDSPLTESACELVIDAGAEVLKVLPGQRSTIIGRIPASHTVTLADALRPWVRTQKPSKTNPKRRPVTIELDFEAWR